MLKPTFLDRLLGRIDKLDTKNVQAIINQLARERSFLETIFNTIEDGILVLDHDGKLIYSNEPARRLLGLHSDSEGQRIIEWIPELEWEKVKSALSDKTSKSVRYEIELHFPRPKFIRVYATAIENEPRNLTGILLILHDETNTRQKTLEMVEAERLFAASLLASTVAHEIGNPLNAINIHLQLIERELKRLKAALQAPPRNTTQTEESQPPSPTNHTTSMNVIEQALSRMDHFLNVAKTEIGRLDNIVRQFLSRLRPLTPKFTPANLNTVVERTIQLIQPEIEDRGLILETKLTASLPEILLDPDQIQQVLINLIKNAMQATTAGGHITIETGDEPEGVWVRIADTGKGMTKEQMANLFQPLTSSSGKGTGLGLMVVHRIVRSHGGRIEVTSQPGKGTSFTIWLPLPQRRPRLLDAGPTRKPIGPTLSHPSETNNPDKYKCG